MPGMSPERSARGGRIKLEASRISGGTAAISAISTADSPREASHSGKNGRWMPIAAYTDAVSSDSRSPDPAAGAGSPPRSPALMRAGSLHHRGFENADHRGMCGLLRHVADDVRPVAAVAQRLAGAGPLGDIGDRHFKLALEHREALDRAALMRVGFERAAGIGGEIVPLQPFDRLDPADDGEPAFAVVGDEDRRVRAGGFFQERLVLGRLQDALDGDVERLREAPDRRQRRVRLVALDLADDRFCDAGLL